MFSRIRRITLLTIIFAIGACGIRSDQPMASDQRVVPSDAHASVAKAGVKLRKLHLVRPDLIPYPLSLEVYC